ncbi:MAG TPA: sigma-70 family RNA polymerase sigma factor [Tissierellaceae bacterium]|nr:sigma-70 family RNA polymerase sigma factor [Tissierellaceae bacterium]
MRKLTKDQQKIVEDNHNLIYDFLHRRGLNVDEYYGLVAESLCKAVLNWDKSKGKLSTLFYIIARNDIYKEWRGGSVGIYQFTDTVPLEEDWIPENYDLECEFMLKETIKDVENSEYNNLFQLKLLGYNNKQIAEMFGVSQSTIGNWIRKMGERYFDRKR